MRSLWSINKISTQKHSQCIIQVWAGYESLKTMQISVTVDVEIMQQRPCEMRACVHAVMYTSLGLLGVSAMG